MPNMKVVRKFGKVERLGGGKADVRYSALTVSVLLNINSKASDCFFRA